MENDKKEEDDKTENTEKTEKNEKTENSENTEGADLDEKPVERKSILQTFLTKTRLDDIRKANEKESEKRKNKVSPEIMRSL